MHYKLSNIAIIGALLAIFLSNPAGAEWSQEEIQIATNLCNITMNKKSDYADIIIEVCRDIDYGKETNKSIYRTGDSWFNVVAASTNLNATMARNTIREVKKGLPPAFGNKVSACNK